MAATPTSRTVDWLRRQGWLAAVVEVYISAVRRYRDLFGVADVLAVHPHDRAVLLVQATSLAHVGDRLRRLAARPELPGLLAAGLAVEVWGWRRRGRTWEVKRVAARPGDLPPQVVQPLWRRSQSRHRQGELFAGQESDGW
jgi:hypothetical protein